MRWSPDGRALLVGGKDRKLQQGLYLIDAQTGEATAAVIWGDRAIAHAAWFPDGKRLLYLSQRGEAGTALASVVIRELATSEEKVLFQPAPGVEINGAALSPDGRQVALTLLEKETQSAVLKVLPLAGGEARELVRAKEPERIAKDSLSWSSDSRYVVFSKGRVTSQGPKTELFAISPRGGEPHALGLAMDSVISSVSFHSDGRHLAFAVNAGNKMEIWVMENFLPEAKAAK
jgi:Tol biopolymer transport system component